MRKLLRASVLCAAGLGLAACITVPSEFDYTAGSSEVAVVELPYPLRIVGINGQSVSLPPVLEFPYTASLAAGETTLAFQYGEPWGQGDENQLVRGPIMEVQFTARANAQYAVDFIRPDDVRARELAEPYVAEFRAWLRSETGQRVDAVQTGSVGGPRVGLAGNQPVDETPPDDTPSQPSSSDSTRLEALKALWNSAAEAERKAFMQWVIAPDS